MSRPVFLADEDLRNSIVQAFRRIEPAASFLTIDELGKKGIDDAEVLELALSNGWIVVSHDVTTIRPLANCESLMVAELPGCC